MSKQDKVVSALSDGMPKKHYDIYAIIEASQELYFGDEKEVNVNIVEKVRVWTPVGEKEKCYISPTKRRGVERRCLLWSDAGGKLLMDKIEGGCGIPNTCCMPYCPICRVFGGLITGEEKKGKEKNEPEAEAKTDDASDDTNETKGKKKKERRTFIGRLTHSGGVAVTPQIVLEKQRAMHPAMIYRDESNKQEPMPYRKEYAQPGLLYPVSNHCLSISEEDFSTVAYAFLMSLNRLGAGNPKGVAFARAAWNEKAEQEPLLVVDEYRVPMGERPIISPSITDNKIATDTFIKLAKTWPENETKFVRSTGSAALKRLQAAAKAFEETHLKA